MEQTVVLVKPDAMQRGLTGEIISRFEQKGLKLVAVKMMELSDEVLDDWYVHHKDKPFFKELKKFMQSSPIVAMLWEGVEAVEAVRKLCGVTKSRIAEAGSIRGDLAMSNQLNLVHASDSLDTAEKERNLIFSKDEIFDYSHGGYHLIYSADERG
jgi:nucleoside-diphosphate kinase